MFNQGKTIEFRDGKTVRSFMIAGQKGDVVVLFMMPALGEAPLAAPFRFRAFSLESLQKNFLAGNIKFVFNQNTPSFTSSAEVVNKEGEDKEQTELDRRLEAVESVLDSKTLLDLMTRSGRAKRISEAAAKFKFNIKQMRRLVVRYLVYGLNPSALRAMHWKKGGPGKCREAGEAKRGAPVEHRERGLRGGVNVTLEIRAKVYPFVLASFKTAKKEQKKVSLHDVWLNFIKIEYRDGFKNGKPQLKAQEDTLSFSAFKAIYYRSKHPTEVSQAIHGKRHDRDHREKLGSEAERSLFAGSQYQGDFTIVGCKLVHPIYRQAVPIGQPLAGLMADVYSSVGTGITLSMENESALQGLLLIENALSDKTDFLRRLGLDPAMYPIPGGIIPQELYFDNGALRGKLKRAVPRNLRIRFSNTCPYRCDLKGTIESAIGQLFGWGIRLFDGRVNSDHKRGDACEVDGQYDPNAMLRILLLALAFRNGQIIKDKYQTMAALADRISPRPMHMWTHSISKVSGILRAAPAADELRFMLFPRATATIDGDARGIVFEGMYYSNQMLIDAGVLVKARASGVSKVQVVFDPRLIDFIYLVSDARRSLIQPLLLSDRSAYLRDRQLAFRDVKEIQVEKKVLTKVNSHEDAQTEIDFKHEVNEIAEQQKDLNKSAKKTVRSFPKMNKKEAKAAAAEEGSKADARGLGGANPSEKLISFPKEASGKLAHPIHKPLTARERLLAKHYKNK